jgi:hypothetical protein
LRNITMNAMDEIKAALDKGAHAVRRRSGNKVHVFFWHRKNQRVQVATRTAPVDPEIEALAVKLAAQPRPCGLCGRLGKRAKQARYCSTRCANRARRLRRLRRLALIAVHGRQDTKAAAFRDAVEALAASKQRISYKALVALARETGKPWS